MKVSVLIPCHNAVPTLVRALESVRLALLPTDGEIVAVDDGSDDGTGVVLKAYAEAYKCLRYTILQGPPHGVSAARNAALKLAQGEYIMFVDADDTVEPDFCTKALAAMVRDKADYCLFGYWRVARESAAARTEVKLKESYHYTSGQEIREKYLPRLIGYSLRDVGGWLMGRDMYAKKRESGEVWRGCYRRALIEEQGLQFDEKLCLNEDALFTVQYLLAAQSMTSVEEPLYDYTVDSERSAVGRVKAAPELYCANKLELLRERKRLDKQMAGKLKPLYRGSNWLSLGEIALRVLKGNLPRREGFRLLKTYLKEMSK